MKIYHINHSKFNRYGQVLENRDFNGLIEILKTRFCPNDVVYVASDVELEACEDGIYIQNNVFGGLPVQIGYCNGHNVTLNALEYHKSSEVNIMATDAIFMVGYETDITEEGNYDTSNVELFYAPAGSAVELYGTTLHYAPCQVSSDGFKVAVVLPKGTNEKITDVVSMQRKEDERLFAINKWLIGHCDGKLPENAFVGLVGENLELDTKNIVVEK